MKLKISTTIIILCVQLGCAMPSGSRQIQSKVLPSCRFAEMSDYYYREILFNIFYDFIGEIQKEHLLSGPVNQPEVIAAFGVGVERAQSRCGELSRFDFFAKKTFFAITSIEGEKINFNSFDRPYVLQRFSKDDKVVYGVSHKNLTLKNEPYTQIFEMIYEKDQLQSIRIRGRMRGQDHLHRIVFYDPSFSMQHWVEYFPQNLAAGAIKSLKSIYGFPRVPLKADTSVGVIGSGIDYNHPDLAEKMAFRSDIEAALVDHEALESKLHAQMYVTDDDLIADLKRYQAQQSVGFPLWLDQLEKTPFPFDHVFPPQRDLRYHETMVASRVVRNISGVRLVPVRIAYNPNNDFAAIVDRLAKENVRVINMSFGDPFRGQDMNETVWRSIFERHTNILFVISAGNHGYDIDVNKISPAVYGQYYDNVVVVSSLGVDGGLSDYKERTGGSNYGVQSSTVAVQGDGLEVAVPLTGLRRIEPFGGTSIGAGEVSNLALRFFQNNKRQTPKDFKDYIMKCSHKSDKLREKIKSGGFVTIDQPLAC